MAIRRYVASSDNTITNAYEMNLSTRGTGSNMGASDVSEVFHIYGQQDSGSLEAARILTQFPIADITTDRAAGTIPASGSVNFYLRMFNARHSETVPRDFELYISAISQSWEEGNGLDMEGYTDLTYDATGSNWNRRAAATSWDTAGGDYFTAVSNTHLTLPTTPYV